MTFDLADKQTVIKPLGSMAPSWYFGPALDSVHSARYHGNSTGLEFDLPSDWSLAGTWPSDIGDIAVLKNAYFGDAFAAVWMKRRSAIPKQLEEDVRDIVAQRSELQGHKIIQESFHQTFIGGHPALTAEHTTTLFFARVPVHDLEVFQVRFDQIIYAATAP